MAGDIEYGVEDYRRHSVNMSVSFSNYGSQLIDFTIKEVMLGESLLTPGLQTSIKADSYIHNINVKDFDLFKGSGVRIILEKEALGAFGILEVNQLIYRLDNRRLINNQTETMMLRACDPSLLNDAETLVSKSWKCETPSSIAEYVLRSCAGVENLDIEEADPARDYIAENIHPFQVVNQQANYALADGTDPSFLHYMTYQNGGTHHFRSLKTLTDRNSNPPVATYTYNDTASVYPNLYSIMTYSFPCDFDLLSDVLNGIDTSGRALSSVALFDPLLKSFSLMGNNTIGCGVGEGVFRYAISNQLSGDLMDACPDYAKEYLLKRQARMSLLEKNKIALRLTVPFNPRLNVGKIIEVDLYNKESLPNLEPSYGSGDYLILNMFHHIVAGGLAVTSMDCVSTTVGQGEV